jgi:hypothetical protein
MSNSYRVKHSSAATETYRMHEMTKCILANILSLESAFQRNGSHFTIPVVATRWHDQDSTPEMQDHTTDSCAQLLHFAQKAHVSS